jgi:hypothetical protein
MYGMKLLNGKLRFDGATVVRATRKAMPAAWARIGAFIRAFARSSIRARKKVSAVGSPPSSHEGTLKDLIRFGLDDRGLVVGPMKTNQIFFNGNRKPVKGTVPEVLEKGGKITILEALTGQGWRRLDLLRKRRFAGLPTRYRTVTIAPRPFMSAALADARDNDKLSQAWKDSVK